MDYVGKLQWIISILATAITEITVDTTAKPQD